MGNRTVGPLVIFLLAFALAGAGAPARAGDANAPAFSVESARYEATVRAKKLDVSADFVVQLLRDEKAFVPLLPADAAIADLKVVKGDAHPSRTAAGAGFSAEKKGEYRLSLRFVLNVDERGKTGRVVFPLAGAGQSSIALALPPGQKVETKPEAPVSQTAETPQRGVSTERAVRIFPPGGDKIEIEWYPEEYAKEIAPVLQARDATGVCVEAGLVTRRTRLDLSVIRGRVDTLQIQIPATADVQSFRGADVREWRVETLPKEKVVTVTFAKPVRGETKLDLSLQEPFTLGGQVVVAPVKVVGASQQQGRLVIQPAPEVSVREAGITGARKSDTGRASDKTGPDTSLVYEYDALPAEVRLIAEAAKPKLTADVQSLATLERGIISLSSIVQYTIRGARVRTLKIKTPPALSVMAVTGPCPLDWTTEAGTLLVRLRGHAEGQFALKVEAQQNLAKMNGIPIPRLETLDTESETGTLGVAVGPDVNLIPHTATKTRQVDPSQLPEWMRKRGAKLGYAYSEKGGDVAVSTIKVEPRITAKVTDLATVGAAVVYRKVAYACAIEQRPVFAFKVKLPAGVTVTNVTGDKVADWTLNAAEDALTITLASEITGQCAFVVEAETRSSAPVASQKLGGLDLDGAEKVEGWLGVAPQGDVDLKATSTTGLTSVAVADIPSMPVQDRPPTLGYKFGRVGWTLALDVLPLAPQLDVKLLSLLRFRPGLLSVVAEAQCNVKKAGLNVFEVELPKGALNSTIEADGMRASEFKNGVWRLDLMDKVTGEYFFTINYDVPLGGLSGSLAYTGARVRGAVNQTGFDIVAQEKSDAEIAVGEVVGATAVDDSELPREFAERVTIPVVRTYRWVAPDRRIAFKVTGHLAGKTLQATIPLCEIKTLLKRDGQAINYMTCPGLSNTSKQFIRLDLGPKSRLWAAYLDGRPVKASRAPDGAVMVPILGKGRGGRMELGLIWSAPLPPMGLSSRVRLIAPRMDVAIQAVSWRVFMPGDYQVIGSGGNMEMQGTRAAAAGLPTILAGKFGWVISWVYSVVSPILVITVLIVILAAVVWGVVALFRRGQVVLPVLIIVAVMGILLFIVSPAPFVRYRLSSRHMTVETSFVETGGGRRTPAAPTAAPAYADRGALAKAAPVPQPARAEGEIGMKQQAQADKQPLDEKRKGTLAEEKVTSEVLKDADRDGRLDGQGILRKRAQESQGRLLAKKAEAAKEERKALDQAAQPQPPVAATAPAPPGAPAPSKVPLIPGAPAPAEAAAGGGGALGYAGREFARAPAKPAAGPQPVALGAATTPAQVPPIFAADKLAHMQQPAAETSLVMNLVGGRAKGALPIEITFPTAGTVDYEFRMPFAGETQGEVRLSCLRTGAALCLQGLLGLLVLGLGIGFGWRRADVGTLVAVGGIVLLGFLRGASGPAGVEYLRTAQWAAAVVLIVLLGRHLALRLRVRAVLPKA